jgi:ketosteroid isomerase-like protein
MRTSREVRLSVLGALCLAGLAGCGSSSEKTLPAKVTTQMEDVVNSGNSAGCVGLFTDDAEVLQEDAAVVRGKQAIQEFCAGQIHPELSLDTTTTMSLVSGSLAFEQGTYRFRNVKIGANVEFGEYLNVWKRDGDHWRIFRSMYDKTEALRGGVSAEEEPETE